MPSRTPAQRVEAIERLRRLRMTAAEVAEILGMAYPPSGRASGARPTGPAGRTQILMRRSLGAFGSQDRIDEKGHPEQVNRCHCQRCIEGESRRFRNSASSSQEAGLACKTSARSSASSVLSSAPSWKAKPLRRT
jgi:hypothetical protein